MLAVLTGQRKIAAGDTMDLKFDTSQLHVFDKAGLRITAA
jgi:multiple sugar transport system ATP-binding protein